MDGSQGANHTLTALRRLFLLEVAYRFLPGLVLRLVSWCLPAPSIAQPGTAAGGTGQKNVKERAGPVSANHEDG